MALCLKGFTDGHIRVAAFVKIMTGIFFRGLDIVSTAPILYKQITSWIRAGEWSPFSHARRFGLSDCDTHMIALLAFQPGGPSTIQLLSHMLRGVLSIGASFSSILAIMADVRLLASAE